MQFSKSKNLDPAHLNALWKAIGWEERPPKKWIEALSKSSFVISVWDKSKLIGFGRILEDGTMCMFYDVGVHPDYQGGHKVGPSIMEILIAQVKDKDYASIGLFAWDKNKEINMKFYRQFGFEDVDTGMELIKYMKRE